MLAARLLAALSKEAAGERNRGRSLGTRFDLEGRCSGSIASTPVSIIGRGDWLSAPEATLSVAVIDDGNARTTPG